MVNAGRHRTPRRVYIQEDVTLRVLGLQQQRLGADQASRRVVHVAPEEQDRSLTTREDTSLNRSSVKVSAVQAAVMQRGYPEGCYSGAGGFRYPGDLQ